MTRKFGLLLKLRVNTGQRREVNNRAPTHRLIDVGDNQHRDEERLVGKHLQVLARDALEERGNEARGRIEEIHDETGHNNPRNEVRQIKECLCHFLELHVAHLVHHQSEDDRNRETTYHLQNGDVDVVENINTANDLKTLKDSDDFNVSETVGVRIGFAYINQKGILKNDDLRQAILTAIDDDTLCKVTVGGLYDAGASVLPSTLDYGSDKLKDETPYDEEKANKILDDANIVDTDGDGYRELDGKNIELNFLTYDSRNLPDFAEGVASQLEKIGVKVNVKKTDADTEWNMLVSGEYDLLNTNWMTVQDGDPYGYLDNWYGKSNANYCGYQNDEYDKIYEALSTEMDEEKRKDMIQELQQILIDDSAVMVHGYYKSNMSSDKSVAGANISVADYYWISTAIKPAE